MDMKTLADTYNEFEEKAIPDDLTPATILSIRAIYYAGAAAMLGLATDKSLNIDDLLQEVTTYIEVITYTEEEKLKPYKS